jgi:hypothetical protein
VIKFVLGLLPWWAWAALIAIALATATAWHYSETRAARKEGRDEVQKRWDALEAERDKTAAREALRSAEANLGVGEDYEARRKQTAAAVAAANERAAAATADADGLRDTLSRLAAAPAADLGTAQERADSLGRILGECTGLVKEGERLVAASQERVGALADKVTGLQNYASKVCMTTEGTP